MLEFLSAFQHWPAYHQMADEALLERNYWADEIPRRQVLFDLAALVNASVQRDERAASVHLQDFLALRDFDLDDPVWIAHSTQVMDSPRLDPST